MARSLLRERRFWPFLLLQALGALNDNLYKNALTIAVVLRAGALGPVLVAAAGGIFILPFLLFSAPAGALADRLDKARLVRLAKLAELLLMLAGAAALMAANAASLLAVLFGLGVQAAFFGPVKYAIVPELLAAEDVAAATGWIEAATFLAILLGTIAGPALMALPAGAGIASCGIVLIAALGLLAARLLPALASAAPESAERRHLSRETVPLLRMARARPEVWGAMLGLSWFWAVGTVFVSEFPPLALRFLGGGASLVSLLLSAFVLGVAAGSIAAGRFARGGLRLWPVPWALLAMALFAADFAASLSRLGARGGMRGGGHLLASFAGGRVFADLVLLAAMGGVVSVLLYAVLQGTPAAIRAQMIAANNIMNAVFMLAASVALMALDASSAAPPTVFALLALLALAVAGGAFRVIGVARRGT